MLKDNALDINDKKSPDTELQIRTFQNMEIFLLLDRIVI